MRSSRKSRVILVILVALCALFVYSYASKLGEKSQVETQIAMMRERIDEAKTEQHKLLAERERLNQPDYIDRVARMKFDRALPGDKLLVIIDEPATTSSADAIAVKSSAEANPVDMRTFPIWRQWVVFFTSDAVTISMQ
jgi:cell division protein FtsB